MQNNSFVMGKSIECTICGSQLHGNYCHQCGQRYLGRRVNTWDVMGGWLSGLLSPERALLGTFGQLLKHPARVVHNYWAGFRGYYLSPSQLVVYMLFVLGLHLALVKDDLLGLNIRVTGVSDELGSIFSPQLFFFLMVIPLLAITTAIVYRRQKRSFPEHFTAAIYLFTVWSILFTLVSDAVWALTGWSLSTLLFLVLLFLWSARVFSVAASWYRVVGNALLSVLVIMGIMVLLLGILYLVDPGSVSLPER